MGIPKEPRQAMINMMYLVLTALLALNVSAEILNAFQIVTDGISSSTDAIESKNSDQMTAFAKLANDDKKAKPLYDKAVEAQEIADQAYLEISRFKRELRNTSGWELNEEGDTVFSKRDDTHGPTLYMVNKKHGYELQEMMTNTKEQFLNLYPAEVRESISETMPIQVGDETVKNSGPKKQDWVEYNFTEVPVLAANTILTKLQNDIRNAESDAIKYLINQVTAEILDLDVLKGRAIADKTVVVAGDTYKADLFVTASSSSSTPKAYVGQFDQSIIKRDANGNLPPEITAEKIPLQPGYRELGDPKDGVVEYSAGTSGQGMQSYRGVIAVTNPKTGETKYYPFENEYQVIRPIAVVSPDKMNVLYIGVDNPISVSVPGFTPDQVVAGITQGSLSGSNGKYTARVTSTGEAKISVSVKTKEGTKNMGVSEFRVKRIPDPKVMIGNAEGPVINAGTLKAMPGITAIADNFPFDVNFQVRGFEVLYKKSNSSQLYSAINQGPLFGNEVKNLLQQAAPGDRVWFDNIKVNAPDGTTRTASLSFKVL